MHVGPPLSWQLAARRGLPSELKVACLRRGALTARPVSAGGEGTGGSCGAVSAHLLEFLSASRQSCHPQLSRGLQSCCVHSSLSFSPTALDALLPCSRLLARSAAEHREAPGTPAPGCARKGRERSLFELRSPFPVASLHPSFL
ncbi:unnamed protein product [Prorocentrum cordatum]|uniref:Uncharacterized protein n=1 Tax=Prorocentrum cordatum TaxID=2364126 RepID=A0ABN9XGV3_9DINO|nr:unnamed protein product [Polarella glacialis]